MLRLYFCLIKRCPVCLRVGTVPAPVFTVTRFPLIFCFLLISLLVKFLIAFTNLQITKLQIYSSSCLYFVCPLWNYAIVNTCTLARLYRIKNTTWPQALFSLISLIISSNFYRETISRPENIEYFSPCFTNRLCLLFAAFDLLSSSFK